MLTNEFFVILYFVWLVAGLYRWHKTRMLRPRWYEDIILMITNIIMAPWFIAGDIYRKLK